MNKSIVFFLLLLLQHYALSEKPYEYKSLTWNMQGSSGGDFNNKYSQLGRVIIKGNYDVVALQEVGGVPSDMKQVTRRVTTDNSPFGNGPGTYTSFVIPLAGNLARSDRGGPVLHVNDGNRLLSSILHNVREFTWDIRDGSSSRGQTVTYYYYHLSLTNREDGSQIDVNQRTNLGIVSKYRARAVLVYAENNERLNRPMFGIIVDDNFFFSWHAPAYAVNPSVRIVNSLIAYINQYYEGSDWMIMGDFNRDDIFVKLEENMDDDDKQLVVRSEKATHSTKELDYAVIGPFPNRLAGVQRLIMTSDIIPELHSDHYAVSFHPDPRYINQLQRNAAG